MKYVAHKNDQLGMVALNVMLNYGQMIWPIDGIAPAPADSVIFFTTCGSVPNRFIRLIDLKNKNEVKKNAERRQIVVPEWGQFATFGIAIASRIRETIDREPITPDGFVIAIRQAHYQLHPQPANLKPRVIRTRDQWQSGHHARVRRGLYLAGVED